MTLWQVNAMTWLSVETRSYVFALCKVGELTSSLASLSGRHDAVQALKQWASMGDLRMRARNVNL